MGEDGVSGYVHVRRTVRLGANRIGKTRDVVEITDEYRKAADGEEPLFYVFREGHVSTVQDAEWEEIKRLYKTAFRECLKAAKESHAEMGAPNIRRCIKHPVYGFGVAVEVCFEGRIEQHVLEAPQRGGKTIVGSIALTTGQEIDVVRHEGMEPFKSEGGFGYAEASGGGGPGRDDCDVRRVAGGGPDRGSAPGSEGVPGGDG